ncbi:hypothetical protein LVJ94_40050 [Pendulispora rubella]|uniref:Mannosyltransferase n=1 Tax=Pendulispora rubella TaxID=2741070 RepID=A0ABZ2KZA7_9BACT
MMGNRVREWSNRLAEAWKGRARPWHRTALAMAPVVLATLGLAHWAVSGVLAKLGHPGATLDDSFIHFQYARAFAEGHPLRFQAGEPISTGATSLLWPLVLAPFYLVGFRDLAILWPAWILSFAALVLLAQEVYRLARPLAGQAAALSAGAMVPAFGGLVWCAASGMEAVPFAWAIARTIRLSAEWAETQQDRRRARALWHLVVCSWIAFLLRPEGALFTVAAAATLFLFPARSRWQALLPLAMPVFIALLLRVLSGSAISSTAHVKLLVGNPYYTGDALGAAVQYNVKLLFVTLLNGRIWSAEFLPAGGTAIGLLGVAAVIPLGVREEKRWRAFLVVLLAAGIGIACFYVSFLWNRLRYLWPFAPGWFVGLACFARLAGDGLGLIRARWRVLTPILGGCFVGLLASRLDGTLDDVVNSASGIDRQQVKLGRWAKENLPPDARIGLNDTGAIAYFSERRTFDVVGLTTPGEGRYWVAGPGSRYEHYERLAKTDRARLPTHFIVYPEWMACDAVLGPLLTEAVVVDSTVLGGTTMRAHVADWSLLGSGEKPWSAAFSGQEPVDALDVADLESEEEHRYDLAGAREGHDVARVDAAPLVRTPESGPPDEDEDRLPMIAEGGRANRRVERFVLHLRNGAATRIVARIDNRAANVLHPRVNGRELPAIVLPPDTTWSEIAFDVPADIAESETSVEIVASQPFAVFHYWAF